MYLFRLLYFKVLSPFKAVRSAAGKSREQNLLQDLAHNLRTNLKENSRFLAPNRPQHSFGIEHYAGRVVYVTNLMMDKNKDFVVREHQQLMNSSEHPLVR